MPGVQTLLRHGARCAAPVNEVGVAQIGQHGSVAVKR